MNELVAALSKHVKNTDVKDHPVELKKTNKKIIKQFNLPDTEYSISYFRCYSNSLKSGYVYITPLYLCFGRSVFSKYLRFDHSDENQFVIKIMEISELRKTKTSIIKLSYRKGSSLEIVLIDKSVITLKGFMHRDECVDLIVEQAEKIDYNIKVIEAYQLKKENDNNNEDEREKFFTSN
eukprot:TRINITY_DN14816_c0_g1_i1.p1 TRINITY_DN14816_c0_g1~~TRINITY_DN14816_c0_g1_i1.p1  ORF type:complete len:179 (+),score=35.07 TRINITY_DN14816_c0_g1_i1:1-537(+)